MPYKPKRNTVIKWEPAFLPIVTKHIEQGGSMSSAAGALRISMPRWSVFIKTIPELKELNNHYKNTLNYKGWVR